MGSQLSQSDFLIVVAFPDFYIYYPDTWHKQISKTIGISKGEKVMAGHSCALTIEGSSGRVAYFDFGRYAVPHGTGRARTVETDPELAVEVQAVVEGNTLVNLVELMEWFYHADWIHHGAGPMYYKVLSAIDLTATKSYAQSVINQGFVPYEIFGMSTLNCSRYIYHLIKSAISQQRLTPYFKYLVPSATPLDNVMHADVLEPLFVYQNGEHHIQKYAWIDSITYYFKQRKGFENKTDRVEIPSMSWIGSQGIGSYFSLQRNDFKGHLSLLKYSQEGIFVWSRLFRATDELDLSEDYKIDLGQHPDHFVVVQEKRRVDIYRMTSGFGRGKS